MNNQMLHRGALARLTSSLNRVSILSTCLLLLVHFQISHAHPTSPSFLKSGPEQQPIEASLRVASPSTTYGSAYPYSSYRPGARLEDSYRPYRTYPESYSASSSGLYNQEAAVHPNSVYSRQSVSDSQNLNKFLQYIEKEIEASDLKDRTFDKQEDSTPEQKQTSPPALSTNNKNTPIRNNKPPRRLPLPSVQQSFSTTYEINNDRKQQQNNNAEKEQQTSASATFPAAPTLSEESNGRSADFSPVPPPFAPELDPQYERRQYGLGALTLLDQAGPFW